uniref:Secreted protein n=1 Tax=Ascaris lumbricoides TaxID=6252 RepID=A0A0M3HR92_ASCLU
LFRLCIIFQCLTERNELTCTLTCYSYGEFFAKSLYLSETPSEVTRNKTMWPLIALMFLCIIPQLVQPLSVYSDQFQRRASNTIPDFSSFIRSYGKRHDSSWGAYALPSFPIGRIG